jgi:predicted nucleotidyltransferase component of viral defense system
VTLFRDRSDFHATIAAAEEPLGVSAVILEKDYWVTQVLRVLAARFPDGFVFKGGTSLSKCYKIIERFSEDIDLLVVTSETSKNAKHRLMKRMGTEVGDELGMEVEGTSDSRTGVHKSFWLTYPPAKSITDSGFRRSVKLEMSTRSGTEPSESKPISPLIAEALSDRSTEFDDLRPFGVKALHPGRTLIEKLCVIHTELGASPTPDALAKYTRHYYDIYHLLADGSVLALLENESEVREIERSMQQVMEEDPDLRGDPRPDGGWATSPALKTTNNAIQKAYDTTIARLHLGSTKPPTFADVCGRVREYRHLL